MDEDEQDVNTVCKDQLNRGAKGEQIQLGKGWPGRQQTPVCRARSSRQRWRCACNTEGVWNGVLDACGGHKCNDWRGLVADDQISKEEDWS